MSGKEDHVKLNAENVSDTNSRRRKQTKDITPTSTSVTIDDSSSKRCARPKRKISAKFSTGDISKPIIQKRRKTVLDPKRGKIIDNDKTEKKNLNINISQQQEPSDNIFAYPSEDVSLALLELSLYRQSIIDDYFDLSEKLLFSPPPGNGGFDELMYSWIVGNDGPSYIEYYSEAERIQRKSNLKSNGTLKRKSHALALEKLKTQTQQHPEKLADATIIKLSQQQGQEEQDQQLDNDDYDDNKNEKLDAANMQWIKDWIKNDKVKVVRISPLADWTPKEICYFELSLCHYGQNFLKISQFIETKSYKECYTFYAEIFKQSNRYLAFKTHKKLAAWYGG